MTPKPPKTPWTIRLLSRVGPRRRVVSQAVKTLEAGHAAGFLLYGLTPHQAAQQLRDAGLSWAQIRKIQHPEER